MKIIILILLTTVCFAQNKVNPDNLHSEYADSNSRAKQKAELSEYTEILENFTPGKFSDDFLIHILKELSLTLTRGASVEAGLGKILSAYADNSVQLNYSALETAKALFPDKFNKSIEEIFKGTSDKTIAASSAMYLIKYPECRGCDSIKRQLESKFPNWKSDEYLERLFGVFSDVKKPLSGKEIVDLLSHKYQKGKVIIFTLFRNNRNFPGITIIRKPDGKFVRGENGEIFRIPQLALAVADFPGFMKYGNTPTGIFSVTGFYNSPTESIGPTPSIITRLPFEKSPEIFFHGRQIGEKWNLDIYKNLLPPALRSKTEFYESYYAGKFGRRLLVMHGSTDNLTDYQNENYYPLSPTKGCISSTEIWDSSGGNIRSDQAKLINAYFSAEELNGFLIVAELNNENRAVALKDVKEFILKAERKFGDDGK